MKKIFKSFNFSIAMCASVLALGLAASSAAAQVTQQTRDTCYTTLADDPDAAVAACTAIIDADQGADAKILSGDYYSRGSHYELEFRDDEALADYRTALKLYPDNSAAQSGIDDLTH